jgi:hypothetical protein
VRFPRQTTLSAANDITSLSETTSLLLEKEFQKNCLDLDISQTSSGETDAVLGQ